VRRIAVLLLMLPLVFAAVVFNRVPAREAFDSVWFCSN